MAVLLNPITTSVNTANRSWTDANLDYVPDCDLGNFGQNGECGALDNQNFGKSNPNAVRWSDDVREGWGTRDYNWEFGSEVQHELTRGLSLNGGYYFNTGGYFRNTDSAQRVNNNLAVAPEDFDSFCVTAPLDLATAWRRRLPDLRSVQRQAREIRPVAGARRIRLDVRRGQASQPLLRRRPERAPGEGHPSGRRVRRRPLHEGPVLRRRRGRG